MKLLYCLHCHDLVLLRSERRSCFCGKSWGQYLEDNMTTVQNYQSISIGLHNRDLKRAVEVYLADQNYFSPELVIRAWINPDSESDVTYDEADKPLPPEVIVSLEPQPTESVASEDILPEQS